MCLECTDEKHQIQACCLIICLLLVLSLCDYAVGTPSAASLPSWAVTYSMANTTGISQLATAKGEGQKGMKTSRGKPCFKPE